MLMLAPQLASVRLRVALCLPLASLAGCAGGEGSGEVGDPSGSESGATASTSIGTSITSGASASSASSASSSSVTTTEGTESGASATEPSGGDPTGDPTGDTEGTTSGGSATESDSGTESDSDSEGETGEYPNDASPLGINISPVRDWVPQWMFVDGFAQARPWIPQEVDSNVWDTGLPIALDAEGWIASLSPNQAAATLLYTTGHYPGGEYRVLYEGAGELEFRWDAKVVEATPGEYRIDVTPEKGIYLRQLATDPDDPLRAIRVIPPGFIDTYESEPFHPEFLARAERFKVLRMMDLQSTNNSPLVHWADRPRPGDAGQASERGVALEHLIGLANTLHADPWFCMPHRADDDYVQSFAAMVHDQLDPDLKVYVEYSNEVWNSGFEQSGYAKTKGLELGLAQNPFEAQLRFYARRATEVFAIWEGVFGGDERLVRVLGSQAANPWVGTTIMDWEGAYEQADALAVAPYFGGPLGSPDTQDEVAMLSVEELLAASAMSMDEVLTTAETSVMDAESRGLVLIAYEAGQHLAAFGNAVNNDGLTDLFLAANRDPGMGALYGQYLEGWKSAGGQLMVMFNYVDHYTKWGSWGLLEFQDQPIEEAPKYMSTVEFLDHNAQWW